ncbi:MAG: DUF1588 domain-containing protein [Bdellovibrionales bacterium]|nr:DUF1588 domain-containing protein [Bdellovibrionales bacterium]
MRPLMFLFFTLALAIISVESIADASHLSQSFRLRRISSALTGTNPTPKDYSDLKDAILRGELDLFLNSYVDQIFASDQFVDLMEVLVEELFRMKSFSDSDFDSAVSYRKSNSFNFLVREIIQNNRPWKDLLIAHDYKAFGIDGGFASIPSDFGYFRILQPQLPPTLTGVVSGPPDGTNTSYEEGIAIGFPMSEPRIAGALTTARFTARYSTTAVNKNRGRAAAVLRIFLCDDLVAAIPDNKKGKDDLLNLIYPDTADITDSDRKNSNLLTDSIHGSNPDCRACHYKLDPIGKSFSSIGLVLSPFAQSSELVFKRPNGDIHRENTAGIGDMGEKISNTPEYVSCQVNHFWNWFYGDKDLELDKQQLLEQKFVALNGRFKDFVKLLVLDENFYLKPKADFQLARDVLNVFQRCDTCHKDVTTDTPRFSKWPIGGGVEEMKYWLLEISEQLDLPHDGQDRKMPPSESPWHPSKEQIQSIKAWINSGAPDLDGKPQVEDI